MKLVNARFPDGLPYAEDEGDAQPAASPQTRVPPPEDGVPGERRRRRCAFLQGFTLHAVTNCIRTTGKHLNYSVGAGAGAVCSETSSKIEAGNGRAGLVSAGKKAIFLKQVAVPNRKARAGARTRPRCSAIVDGLNGAPLD